MWQAPFQLRKRSATALMGMALPVVLLSACGALSVLRSEPTGALYLQLYDQTEYRLLAEGCRSGEREAFFGIDLYSSAQAWQLRAVRQPLGEIGLLFTATTPLPMTVRLDAEHCPLLELALGASGWRVNDVLDLGGRLALDCRLPEGGSLRGEYHFEHCH